MDNTRIRAVLFSYIQSSKNIHLRQGMYEDLTIISPLFQKARRYYNKFIWILLSPQIALQLEKCHNSENDCEHFQAWNFTRFCRAMQMKNQMWSSIAHSITPKTFFHTCPRFDQVCKIIKYDGYKLTSFW